jgi:hypothetical protein
MKPISIIVNYVYDVKCSIIITPEVLFLFISLK